VVPLEAGAQVVPAVAVPHANPVRRDATCAAEPSADVEFATVAAQGVNGTVDALAQRPPVGSVPSREMVQERGAGVGKVTSRKEIATVDCQSSDAPSQSIAKARPV